MPRRKSTSVDEVLRSWASLNAVLCSLSEDAIGATIDAERRGKRRLDVLHRLHQRRSKLRSAREWAALKKEVA